jgi:hypothetical protein
VLRDADRAGVRCPARRAYETLAGLAYGGEETITTVIASSPATSRKSRLLLVLLTIFSSHTVAVENFRPPHARHIGGASRAEQAPELRRDSGYVPLLDGPASSCPQEKMLALSPVFSITMYRYLTLLSS